MKKVLSFVLTLVMILGVVQGLAVVPVNAESYGGGETKEALPELPTSLTLEEVIEKMTTEGLDRETAEINRSMDSATLSGYSEQYDKVSEAKDIIKKYNLDITTAMQAGLIIPALAEKTALMSRRFTQDNLENNFEAEINQIEENAVETFYSAFAAQEMYKAAQNDLALRKDTLKNVERKFKLGAASKMELLQAQNILLQAESELKASENAAAAAKMAFNLKLSYPLLHEITFKADSLEVPELPQVNLEEAIAFAKKERNEIKMVRHIMELQEIIYTHTTLTTASNSSTAKKAKIDYMRAKQADAKIEGEIEIDVRIKYMTMEQKHQAYEVAKSTESTAKEVARIAMVSYNAGMTTLAELDDAQLAAGKAEIGRITALCEYIKSIYAFNYSIEVGTMRITF